MKNFFTKLKKSKGLPAQAGFALLFAVLAASLLLSIGLSIFNLTVKELTLSSYSNQSQFSFYAADSGADCALYWDIKGNNGATFATSSTDTYASSITCGTNSSGSNATITISSGQVTEDAHDATTTFSMPLDDASNNGTSQPYCALVTIAKSDPNDTGLSATTISSNGYNVCTTAGVPVWGNPNLVERTLNVTY